MQNESRTKVTPMNERTSERAAFMIAASKRKKAQRALLAAAALCVLALTVWALVLPGATMANQTFCGQEEHEHTGACYEEVLVCGMQEGDSENASASEGGAVAGTAGVDGAGEASSAGVGGTSSSSAASDSDASSSEGVTDADASSGAGSSGANEAGAVEGSRAASAGNSAASGASAAGTSGDAVMLSGLSAAEASTSGGAGHVHTPACYEKQLVCETPVHKHSLACYSDSSADVETQSDWEATLPSDDEMTGEWPADVLAVAESQLGYAESSANYAVSTDASGAETAKGYSRYGAWFGDAYGDWCAMFVSFCLHYAGVPEEAMPQDANCQNWIETFALEDVQLWRPVEDGVAIVPEEADDGGSASAVESGEAEVEGDEPVGATGPEIYTPKPGDLVFFDWSSDGTADHVGIVRELTEATEDEPAKLKTIEGNAWNGSADAVCYQEYDQGDASIIGYAETLENPENQVATTALANNDVPTVAKSAHTSDFIDLNLYDYNGYINDGKYDADKKYPGFQWNGGAYMYSTTYNRHAVDYIDFGNSNITDRSYGASGTEIENGKSANAVIAGVLYTKDTAKDTGAINWLWWEGSGNVTNRPVGMSTMDASALSLTLGDDSYPALADGTSLSYLFTNNNAVTKQNTQSIDGLFQQDEMSGAYTFNSRENHAQYSDNKFTLYDQIITPNFIVYPFGNFLPFNDITNSGNATQVSKVSMYDYVQGTINSIESMLKTEEYKDSKTLPQLKTMLEKYRDDVGVEKLKTWSAKDAIEDYFTAGGGSGDKPSGDTGLITEALLNKMYNIDWDVETNFFFGMDMTMNFIQPKDGMTGNDNGSNENEINSETNLRAGEPDGIPDYPMEFYFTGDDDVWVYIDGVLFLDLSGIHRHVGGKIDFVNGKVYYYALDTENGGDVSSTPYQTYTFAELLEAAGKSTDGLNEKGSFEDYSTHQFKFYYMERGSGSSVCRMNFNFPLLKQNSISVSKEVEGATGTLGNPDYQFQVLKADADGKKTSDLFIGANTTYAVYDANDTKLRDGVTDANGVFALKAGERAEFTGISENAGKYYVRELLSKESVGDQYGSIAVSGEAATIVDGVKVGTEEFKGADSPVKDISDGATQFRFKNKVDTGKLGSLSIKKQIAAYPQVRSANKFDIQVMLDGKPLPVGTEYSVASGETKETCTVQTEGIITLAPDETATISGILAGTTFAVQETSDSAQGYSVTYSGAEGSKVVTKNDAAQGTVVSNATVGVIVTNNEKGASVVIPGSKKLVAYDGTEREFAFELVEVTSETGATLKEGGFTAEATCKVTDKPESFGFTINYALLDMETLPATRYYRITENQSASSMENNTVYVVEVVVQEDTSAETGPVAKVTRVWKGEMKNGAPDADSLVLCFDPSEAASADAGFTAEFTNALIGDLALSKTVVGDATNKSFTFEVSLAESAQRETLPVSYDADIYRPNSTKGEAAQVVLVTKDEKQVLELVDASDPEKSAPISLKHGERIVIKGIPYGTKWAIAETDADGFVVSYAVTAPGQEAKSAEGKEVQVAASVGETDVAFTNTQMYQLPETGGLGVAVCVFAGLAFAGLALIGARMRRKEQGEW